MQVRTFASFAARSANNLTNQLLRAKIDGRRPLLVSMGTNGLSASWERLNHFVCSFLGQYGTLHIAVRLMLVGSRTYTNSYTGSLELV
jgi:hypothetical protein